MPVVLLPKFLELPLESETEIVGFAFVMDLREKSFLAQYRNVLRSLHRKGYGFEILFLEADEDVLLQRYSQTRRYHPIAKDQSLLDGIRSEKAMLQDLKRAAENVINTSHSNVHELKSKIRNFAKKIIDLRPMRISILSFGFKYGIPIEADLIVDVRFMANPYFLPELRPLDGESKAVADFVLKQKEAVHFLDKYTDLLDYLIPLYEKEGKAYLTIAIGCTGGRHRSVVIARMLLKHLRQARAHVVINHRDIGKEEEKSSTGP
jgi:UPF0042 nucleotide-binding protein